MTVFYYDRSFEGLLTAVFDAYYRRQFPDFVLGEGRQEPMFTEEVLHVSSDTVKAGRVWRALEKKLPRYIMSMIMHVWLSEEEGSDALLYRYIRKVFDRPAAFIGDMGDDDVLQMKKLGLKVARESERQLQFVRFKQASDGTFFAGVSPIYNSLPLSLDYFIDRFRDQKWIVYDMRRGYGYLYDLEKVTEISLSEKDDLIDGKLTDEMMAADEKCFQEMWRIYHKAITIKERINPKLQKQFMPRRYWKYLTEMQ